MNAGMGEHGRDHLEAVCLFALQALPPADRSAVEAQVAACADCRRELQSLRPVVDAFSTWPTGELRPSKPLWTRLAGRIAEETGKKPLPEPPRPPAQDWREVAPGIFCKLLATEDRLGRVTLLVRLVPGAHYPPHVHAGIEELYMLEGDLWVDDKRLYAGDYLKSQPGTDDKRVWSASGCSGVLITSARDLLR